MNKLNEYIDNVSFVGPWFLRIILGVSFFLYGYGKFPLPSEMLVGFGFPNSIAVFVPFGRGYWWNRNCSNRFCWWVLGTIIN